LITQLLQSGLPDTFALAVVAVLGYLFGRSQRHAPAAAAAPMPPEVLEAVNIAREIEQIADSLRQDLAYHRAKVERFKQELSQHQPKADEASLKLRSEAERMLAPTLQLVGQLSTAYDNLRKQSQALATFSGCRQDPLTGAPNAKALEERLAAELERCEQRPCQLSLLLIGLQPTEGHAKVNRESLLRQAMTLIRPRLRPAEFLAKFGLDDIAIALPRTGLDAARELAADLLELLSDQGYPACAALAEAAAHDRPRRLVSRADAALYTARLAGPGAVFQHSGFAIEPVAETAPEAPAGQAVSPAQGR